MHVCAFVPLAAPDHEESFLCIRKLIMAPGHACEQRRMHKLMSFVRVGRCGSFFDVPQKLWTNLM